MFIFIQCMIFTTKATCILFCFHHVALHIRHSNLLVPDYAISQSSIFAFCHTGTVIMPGSTPMSAPKGQT